jgi:uncharacterized repeat protein (TIGR03803 family)
MPRSTLVLQGDTLYGTASGGGPGSYGVVFSLDTNGINFARLHAFTGPPTSIANYGPWGGLALSGNTLYGAAENDANFTFGTIFKLKTDGSDFAVLHYFSTNVSYTSGRDINEDGGLPLASPIIGGNTLFGTAAIRGPSGYGTFFSMQLTEPTVPMILGVTQENGLFHFNWSADPGSSYQVQYSSAADSFNWSNVGGIVLATNSNMFFTEALSDPQRLYRVARLP